MKAKAFLKEVINATSAQSVTLIKAYPDKDWNLMFKRATRYYFGNDNKDELCFAQASDSLIQRIAEDFPQYKDRLPKPSNESAPAPTAPAAPEGDYTIAAQDGTIIAEVTHHTIGEDTTSDWRISLANEVIDFLNSTSVNSISFGEFDFVKKDGVWKMGIKNVLDLDVDMLNAIKAASGNVVIEPADDSIEKFAQVLGEPSADESPAPKETIEHSEPAAPAEPSEEDVRKDLIDKIAAAIIRKTGIPPHNRDSEHIDISDKEVTFASGKTTAKVVSVFLNKKKEVSLHLVQVKGYAPGAERIITANHKLVVLDALRDVNEALK